MSPDIVIIRDGVGYRVLHGHLHLASMLSKSSEVSLNVHGEGMVTVVRTRDGVLVQKGHQSLPLLKA